MRVFENIRWRDQMEKVNSSIVENINLHLLSNFYAIFLHLSKF